MTEYDTAAAVSALQEAVAQDAADATPVNSEQVTQTTETVTPSGQEVQSNQDKPTGLFHDVDPESLSPEMRTIFDGMQKSYTEKTQQIADLRKTYDAFGDTNQVKNAVEFVQALQDPNNLAQLQTEISDYLQTIGFSKAESDAAAEGTVANQETSFDDFDNAPQVDSQVQEQLKELQSFRDQYEQEKLQADIEAALARQETIIRQQNPSYTDEDIQTVYQLSYAYGGDLMSAQNAYETERQRILSNYAASKSSVTDSVSSPSAGPHAQVPTNMSWDETNKFAKAQLAALDGLGGLNN